MDFPGKRYVADCHADYPNKLYRYQESGARDDHSKITASSPIYSLLYDFRFDVPVAFKDGNLFHCESLGTNVEGVRS